MHHERGAKPDKDATANLRNPVSETGGGNAWRCEGGDCHRCKIAERESSVHDDTKQQELKPTGHRSLRIDELGQERQKNNAVFGLRISTTMLSRRTRLCREEISVASFATEANIILPPSHNM